ncbi:MAG: MMPL family transporter [Brachymonas sp.]|nr:MMPL family transporter [Brachymonas sp.]
MWRNKAVWLWALGLLAAVGVIARSSFTTDMSAFLPQSPSRQQQLLVNQITRGSLSRMLLLGLEGGTPEQRTQASRQLAAQMRAAQRFAIVSNGETEAFERDRAFVFAHRYLLSPAMTEERFSEPGLRRAIAQSVQNLASPAGLLLKQLFTRDPTGEVLALMQDMAASDRPAEGEVWASRDGQRALLLAQTLAAGSDTDAHAQTLQELQQIFARMQAAQSELADLRLLLAGAPVLAVEASATIRSEAVRLSLGGAAAVILLLLWIYRSPATVGISLLPVLSGVLAGIACVSLRHGVVHGVTVGFGTTLMGEAIDYSIYYFVQSAPVGGQGRAGISGDARLRPEAWRQRFWPTIRLGLLTSVCGFAALVFAGFSGLAQLGLYSIVGLVVAALVTRFVLPCLPVQRVDWNHASRTGAWLAQAVARLQRLRLAVWGLLLASALVIAHSVWQQGSIWNKNLAALNPASKELQALDAALRRDLGNPDTTSLVVASAPNEQAALQQAEQVSPVLQALVDEGVIASFESPARFLPSDVTQRRRQQALPAADVLQERLQSAVRDLPVDAAVLQPFVQDVAQARAAPLLNRQALQGTALGLAVDAMLQPQGAGVAALLPVRGLSDASGQAASVDGAAVQRALQAAGLAHAAETANTAGTHQDDAGAGVFFIDIGQETAELYSRYFQEALSMALLGLLAIAVLLAATLCSIRRMLRVLLPLAVAELAVVAGLLLSGQTLTLMHFIGLLLIVAVGSNYTLFFDRYDLRSEGQTLTLASLLVANIATVLGFGVLAFSQFPVLHAIGRTVAPGALLAFVLAAMSAAGTAEEAEQAPAQREGGAQHA